MPATMSQANEISKSAEPCYVMRPLADRVVIRREDAPTRTKGGIILPGTGDKKVNRGTVIAAGPGPLLQDGTRGAMECKVGDLVLFSPYAGSEVEIDEQKLLVCRDLDILTVLEPGP